jgi:hypothetical protein
MMELPINGTSNMTTAAAGKAVVDICQKRGEQQTGNLITGTKRGRYVSRAW